jgi:hypothetical protein
MNVRSYTAGILYPLHCMCILTCKGRDLTPEVQRDDGL